MLELHQKALELLPQPMLLRLPDNGYQVLRFVLPMLPLVSNDKAYNESVYHVVMSHAKHSQTPIHGTRLDVPAIIAQLRSDKLGTPSACYITTLPAGLPWVFSEFPLHSRRINKVIRAFNRLVHDFYQLNKAIVQEDINALQQNLFIVLEKHAAQCDEKSIMCLLGVLSGWSHHYQTILTDFPALFCGDVPEIVIVDNQIHKDALSLSAVKREVLSETQQPVKCLNTPWVASSQFHISDIGHLTDTTFLTIHGFASKVSGHTDALLKSPPTLIQEDFFNSALLRQLSHRIDVPLQENIQLRFETWAKKVLQRFSVKFSDGVMVPATTSLLATLTEEMVLEQVKGVQKTMNLMVSFPELDFDELMPAFAEFIYESLQSLQINAGKGLGIGANWDGTVDRATAADTFFYQIAKDNEPLAKRMVMLSLHRQGPAEAKMDASIGVKHELKSALVGLEYMTRIQPHEYLPLIFTALVDGLIAQLLPNPRYLPSSRYTKYRQYKVLHTDNNGRHQIKTSVVEDPAGTFFKDNNGGLKQTPLHKVPGTLEIEPLPRHFSCSEDSRASHDGDPLAGGKLQSILSRQAVRRGDWVYDPLGSESFVVDPFDGQHLLYADGAIIQLQGEMPTNYDSFIYDKNSNLNLESELCASFVVRMFNGANMAEHCAPFIDAFNGLCAQFIAKPEAIPRLGANLPATLGMKQSGTQLLEALAAKNFQIAEQSFHFYFSEIIQAIYPLCVAKSQYYTFGTVTKELSIMLKTCANYQQIIRWLMANRMPEQPQDHLYMAYINYLEQLVEAYFPKPTKHNLQALAQVCREQAKVLNQMPSMRAYFSHIKGSPVDLAPSVSPGMLYCQLQYNGPSKALYQDFYTLHNPMFQAAFRDGQGYQLAEPEAFEQGLDCAVKSVGCLASCCQTFRPLSLITHSVTRPALAIYDTIQSMEKPTISSVTYNSCFALLKEGVWDGMMNLAQLPYRSIEQLASFAYSFGYDKNDHYSQDESPLYFSSAPANERGEEAIIAEHLRDALLSVDEFSQLDLKEALYGKLEKKLTSLEFESLKQVLIKLSDQSFNDLMCIELLAMAKTGAEIQLGVELLKKRAFLTEQVLWATYERLCNPTLNREHTKRKWQLRKSGLALVDEILLIVDISPKDSQKNLQNLFVVGGLFHQALNKRQRVLSQVISDSIKLIKQSQMIKPSPITAAWHKWQQFALAEKQGELLTKEEIEAHFLSLRRIISVAPKGLVFRMSFWGKHSSRNSVLLALVKLEQSYCNLLFFPEDPDLYSELSKHHASVLAIVSFHHPDVCNAISDIFNVTMSRLLTRLIIRHPLFSLSEADNVNPLLRFTPLLSWIAELAKVESNITKLFQYYYEQRHSLEEALFAIRCIDQALSTVQGANYSLPTQAIPKSMVFRWMQHGLDNTRMNGDKAKDEEMRLQSVAKKYKHQRLLDGSPQLLKAYEAANDQASGMLME